MFLLREIKIVSSRKLSRVYESSKDGERRNTKNNVSAKTCEMIDHMDNIALRGDFSQGFFSMFGIDFHSRNPLVPETIILKGRI